ncbi:MAG: BON domain-containing protein [Acidobacteriota bacterium]
MWRSRALPLTLVALVLWIGFCLMYYPPRIQASLLASSHQTLAASGLSEIRLRVEGRSAILEGDVTSPEQSREAERLVRGLRGLRTVENRLRQVDPEPAEPLPAHLELRSRPEGLVLRGPVPSEATKDELLVLAAELVGADRVDHHLVVDPDAEESAALISAAAVLRTLVDSEPGITVRFHGNSLRLAGTLSSDETRRQVDERFRDAAEDVRAIFSLLRVASDEAQEEPPKTDSEGGD